MTLRSIEFEGYIDPPVTLPVFNSFDESLYFAFCHQPLLALAAVPEPASALLLDPGVSVLCARRG